MEQHWLVGGSQRLDQKSEGFGQSQMGQAPRDPELFLTLYLSWSQIY